SSEVEEKLSETNKEESTTEVKAEDLQPAMGDNVEHLSSKVEEKLSETNEEESVPEVKAEDLQPVVDDNVEHLSSEVEEKLSETNEEESVPEVKAEDLQPAMGDNVEHLSSEVEEKLSETNKEESTPEVKAESLQPAVDDNVGRSSNKVAEKLSETNEEKSIPEVKAEVRPAVCNNPLSLNPIPSVDNMNTNIMLPKDCKKCSDVETNEMCCPISELMAGKHVHMYGVYIYEVQSIKDLSSSFNVCHSTSDCNLDFYFVECHSFNNKGAVDLI
ncbi:hypothetical protein DRF75_05080, partial [Ehrlichia minasensis]